MKIGVVFPQIEFGEHAAAIKDYAQTVEELGYTHILAYDHVLGANPDRPGGWHGPYTYQNPFYEVFVLFSYMAGLTKTVELVTGILILPQRQTALVAKQAATLDVLSGGRLRLGIANGWNEVEYVALGENYHNRGRRIEEQVRVLKELWAEPLVTFEGRWHKIPDAGLNPLPAQRSIPIWFGGHDQRVLQRAARLGDGWMPNYRSVEQARPALEALKKSLEAAGRDPGSFGIEPRLNLSVVDEKDWQGYLNSWEEVGATHLTVNTMGCGFQSPEEHIQALRRFKEVIP